MLATKYSWKFEGCSIVLIQISTGKTVVFKTPCPRTPAISKSLSQHMESLTDDNCNGYFSKNSRKP